MYGYAERDAGERHGLGECATSSKLPRDFLPLLIALIHSSSALVVSNSGAATEPTNDW